MMYELIFNFEKLMCYQKKIFIWSFWKSSETLVNGVNVLMFFCILFLFFPHLCIALYISNNDNRYSLR